MVIITTFLGDQKPFHHYWLPLMYKHQECQFHVSGKPVAPKDLKNLHLNQTLEYKNQPGPILKLPINIIPTYRAMIELQKKPANWIGNWEDIGKEWFYVLE